MTKNQTHTINTNSEILPTKAVRSSAVQQSNIVAVCFIRWSFTWSNWARVL